MRPFIALLRHDLAISWREGAELGAVVLFFPLSLALFPFGLGTEPALLGEIAGGVVWVVALLASLLPLDRLFLPDAQDGSLEQWALSPLTLSELFLAKALLHWLLTGLPLLIMTPLAVLLMKLPLEASFAFLSALALGFFSLSLLGTLASALALGTRRAGMLAPLLLLPLYVPILIFGAAAVEMGLAGRLWTEAHMILLAYGVIALPVATLGGTLALRHALEYQ